MIDDDERPPTTVAELLGRYRAGHRNLEETCIPRASLASAELAGVNFSHAHLEGTNLESADLDGAQLEGAHLEGANLSVASLVGALIAFKPLTQLVTLIAGLVQVIPQDVLDASSIVIPQLPMLVLGAMLLAACMIGLRMIED